MAIDSSTSAIWRTWIGEVGSSDSPESAGRSINSEPTGVCIAFRTELVRSRSGFERRLVHSPDRFFLESVIVTPFLLPRRLARRSVAFIQ